MSVRTPSSPSHEEYHDDIIYPPSIAFILVHLACLGAIWTGVPTGALVACIALYVVRMWGVTAGYHRYFSHRSYKTSRVFQFVLAFIAQSTTQKSALWWAAKHRHHHRHSDTEHDVHSPRMRGFWYSHLGWIFDPKHDETSLEDVPDLTKYPELMFLHKNEQVPSILLAGACFAIGGWAGLIVGFFWSTTLLYHGTFFINSLAHVHGKVRYITGDDSRNNWWLAIITLGEGWHNNHHAYQRSTRQGFRWYEFDPTFYVLKAMSWVGLVWDLGAPPEDVVRNERRLGRAVIEKVARQLAASFDTAAIAAQVRAAVPHTPTLAELLEKLAAGQANAEALVAERLAQVQLPHLPTVAEMRARAEQMYADSPSMDEIVERARELLLRAVSSEVVPALG